MLKDYREPEDLLSDDSFLSWYSHRGEQNGSEWDRWMNEVPGRKELVRQAVDLLESTLVREKEVPAGQLHRAEAALFQKIDADSVAARQTDSTTGRVADLAPGRTGLSGHRNWRWIAAASILAVLAGAMIIMRVRSSGQQVLATNYGQLRVEHLPDGSEVTLNANSRIRYANNWHDGGPREVWMDGEAFFQVRKTLNHSTFLVHTDRFDILVTGTQFNVVSRPGLANIMLREGSVIVHGKDGKELDMVPGDFVQWGQQGLNRRVVLRDSVLAWKDRRLYFDKTPLKEVATIIENQYGLKVRLSEPRIGDSTVTGIIRNNDLDALLKAVKAATDLEVINTGDEILIKAPVR